MFRKFPACFLLLALAPGSPLTAQSALNDSGGMLDSLQAGYDVRHYDLTLTVHPTEKSIEGALAITARVLRPISVLRLDLDDALLVRGVTEAGRTLQFEHAKGRIDVQLGSERSTGEELTVTVAYGGRPRIARNPPWDGGFTWARTPQGRPWIATSCQGEGGDLWWPCKDHPSDEPESMDLHVTVPARLVVASNGRLVKVTRKGNHRTYHWHVSTPINNYGVALNIAPYEELKTTLKSVAGDTIPISFYVLPSSAAKGRKLLPEIKDHLRFFEKLFGPYPFRADKYGVAQTPHLGMEHQTIIAYGYRFRKDRFGYDWLHHHELSHEWFGNLVTASDWRDFWIHEGIGTYCQALYIEQLHGMKGYREELKRRRRFLRNRHPVAPRKVRSTHEMSFGGDNDVYYKGAWMLHTLRWLIGKEALLKTLRRMTYPDPALEKTTDGSACHFATTDDFVATAERVSGRKLGWFFEVYLRRAALPRLHHELEGDELHLRWKAPDDLPFPLPVPVGFGSVPLRVTMPDGRATIKIPQGAIPIIDPDHWLLRALPRNR